MADEQGITVETSGEALSFLKSKGMHVVAQRIAEIVSRSSSKLNVVTGLRTIEDILFLIRTFPHARVICVEADARTRFERHLRRARDQDVKSFGDFIAQDEYQAKFGIFPVAHEIAHETLKNEGPVEQFHRKIDGHMDNASTVGQTAKMANPNWSSELRRCLVALDQIGRAATCDEIADQTRRLGFPVRKYNTNRALKDVPEFATRVQKPGQLLRYRIRPRGRKLLDLFDVLAGRRVAHSLPHQHNP